MGLVSGMPCNQASLAGLGYGWGQAGLGSSWKVGDLLWCMCAFELSMYVIN